MEQDNWKHRSDNMRCRTCMFFVEKTQQGSGAEFAREGPPRIGRCRRHAPTLGGWPVVFMADWCGDHKLDENKL